MSVNQFAALTCLLSLFFLNSSVSSQPACDNCCNQTGYTALDEPRRSTKSVWRSGQTPLCDGFLRRGWYRFTSFNGSKMPETAVTGLRCGTHDPVWLSGSHPTTDEGIVTRKACVTSFGNTCSSHLYINIKNCGGYFVYYLKPLYYCAVAYCAGKMDFAALSVCSIMRSHMFRLQNGRLFPSVRCLALRQTNAYYAG